MDTRSRVVRFFRKYNPEKLHAIDGILERYADREDELFRNLERKYGPEPQYEDDGVVISSKPETPEAEEDSGGGGETAHRPDGAKLEEELGTTKQEADKGEEEESPSDVNPNPLDQTESDMHLLVEAEATQSDMHLLLKEDTQSDLNLLEKRKKTPSPSKQVDVDKQQKEVASDLAREEKSEVAAELDSNSSFNQQEDDPHVKRPSSGDSGAEGASGSGREGQEEEDPELQSFNPEATQSDMHLLPPLASDPGQEEVEPAEDVQQLVNDDDEGQDKKEVDDQASEDSDLPPPPTVVAGENKPEDVKATEGPAVTSEDDELPPPPPLAAETEATDTAPNVQKQSELNSGSEAEKVTSDGNSAMQEQQRDETTSHTSPPPQRSLLDEAENEGASSSDEEEPSKDQQHEGVPLDESPAPKAAVDSSSTAEESNEPQREPEKKKSKRHGPSTSAKTPSTAATKRNKSPPTTAVAAAAASPPRMVNGVPAYMASTKKTEARVKVIQKETNKRKNGGGLDDDDDDDSDAYQEPATDGRDGSPEPEAPKKKVQMTLHKKARESLERAKSHQESAQREREERLAAECTFQPGISAFAHKMNRNFDEETEKWGKDREKHLAKLRKKAVKEELKEVKEQVELSTNSKAIIEKMKAEKRHSGIIQNWQDRRSAQEERRKQLEKDLAPTFTPQLAPTVTRGPGGATKTSAAPATAPSTQKDRLYAEALAAKKEKEEKAKKEEAEKKRQEKKVGKDFTEKKWKEMQKQEAKSKKALEKVRLKEILDSGETFKPKLDPKSEKLLKGKREGMSEEEKLAALLARGAKEENAVKKRPPGYISPEEKLEKEMAEHHPPSKKLTVSEQEQFLLRQRGHLIKRSEARAKVIPTEEQNLEECTFAPRISHISALLAEKSEKVKNHKYTDPTESHFVAVHASDSEVFQSANEQAKEYIAGFCAERHEHHRAPLPSSHHAASPALSHTSSYAHGGPVGHTSMSKIEQKLMEKRRQESESAGPLGGADDDHHIEENTENDDDGAAHPTAYSQLLEDKAQQDELLTLNKKRSASPSSSSAANNRSVSRNSTPPPSALAARRSRSPQTMKKTSPAPRWESPPGDTGRTSSPGPRSSPSSKPAATSTSTLASPSASSPSTSLNTSTTGAGMDDIDAKIANLEAAVANWKSADRK